MAQKANVTPVVPVVKVVVEAGKKATVQELVWQKDGQLLARYPGVGEVLFNVPKYRGRPWSDKLTLDEKAERHGWYQKVGDLKSGGTSREKYEMALRQRAAFEQNSWDLIDRAVPQPDFGLIMEACSRFFGISVEKVATELKDVYKTPEAVIVRLKELAADKRISALMLEIEAERERAAAAAVTTELKL